MGRDFAAIVRSSDRVRGAFERVAGVGLWWRLVLALHGKPVGGEGSKAERLATLSRGFRFYGRLYMGLGLLLLAGAGAWLSLDPEPSRYWAAVCGFGALYLTTSSRLAFAGAGRIGAGEEGGAALLAAFFASVMIFLAAFGALLSLWLHGESHAWDLPNVACFAGFILFGVGSYMIELLYLVWWESGRSRPQDF